MRAPIWRLASTSRCLSGQQRTGHSKHRCQQQIAFHHHPWSNASLHLHSRQRTAIAPSDAAYPSHSQTPEAVPAALTEALTSLKSLPIYKVNRTRKLLFKLSRRRYRKAASIKARLKPSIIRRVAVKVAAAKQKASSNQTRKQQQPTSLRSAKSQTKKASVRKHQPVTSEADGPVIAFQALASKLYDVPPNYSDVARLHHGLDKVLRDPRNVHWYKDQNTHELNFSLSPEIGLNVPQPDEMKMSELVVFKKPSTDLTLRHLAQRSGASFCGSTSSLTRVFLHLWRMFRRTDSMNTLYLSDDFPKTSDLSEGALVPPTLKLTYKGGTWFTDSESGFDPTEGTNELLSQMGHIGEKMLTSSNDEFAKYQLTSRHTAEEGPLAYAYSRYGNLLMRSQIDCYDDKLPRKTFDVKFRATVSLRLDRLNYEEGRFYEIKNLKGEFESFERELFDLYRNAFLKYSLQARIGNMDGIFVCFHNTRKVFGFQYWPVEEMDKIYASGSSEASQLYVACLGTLEQILQDVLPPGEENMVVYLTVEYRKPLRQLHVYVKLPKQNLIQHRFKFVSRDESGNIQMQHTQVTDDEAYEAFTQCRNRQLRFSSLFAPANLSEEERAIVQAHNQAQTTKKSTRKLKETPAASAFASSLIQGITYNLEPWPYVAKIREMSRANREREAQEAASGS